jgi:hypothetical protein
MELGIQNVRPQRSHPALVPYYPHWPAADDRIVAPSPPRVLPARMLPEMWL